MACIYEQVLPIVGNRYKCIDCKEKIGFDLCGDCYSIRSEFLGRFNQQHSLDHRFKLVEPDHDRNKMLKMIHTLGNMGITAGAFEFFDGGSR